MTRSPRLLAAAALLLVALPAAAAPRLVASFDDAADDATGPGTYVPPGDTEFVDGDFDLRRFAVLVDGDDVLFEVTLGAPFRRPQVTQRTNSTALDLSNGLYLQNIDIYVDSDPTPGSGSSACIPGRRVTFAGGRTWESAIVLTPQPGPVRAVTESALPELAHHVLFPMDLQVSGRTVTARVPAAFLGGLPERSWGYSVHVSGARWERSFTAVDRLVGRREADAYTLPVLGVREAWAFGGAPAGNAHPRVVDVLLPPGVDQRAVLGSFDARTGAFAQVPFVYADGGAASAASSPAAPASPLPARPAFTVADVSGGLLTIAGPVQTLAPMQIGRVLDADGATVARVAITQVLENGAAARSLEGGERIVRGARVEFDQVTPGRGP